MYLSNTWSGKLNHLLVTSNQSKVTRLPENSLFIHTHSSPRTKRPKKNLIKKHSWRCCRWEAYPNPLFFSCSSSCLLPPFWSIIHQEALKHLVVKLLWRTQLKKLMGVGKGGHGWTMEALEVLASTLSTQLCAKFSMLTSCLCNFCEIKLQICFQL